MHIMHLRKLKGRAETQGGFTLIELLVVIGILAILLAITLIALNPNQHFQGARNAQRSSNVSEILNAIYEYQAQNNGNLPPSVNGTITGSVPLGKGILGSPIDLCADLVPAYIADMPMDPSAAAPTGGPTPCDSGTTAYDSGYLISKTTGGRFTVSAPATEPNSAPDITVTR
jgi:prepilin-type N-terminal cleavage/methylation domain-containing protein